MSRFWRRLLGRPRSGVPALPAADWLVAHRGYPACFPENSMAGLEAALTLGARWLEIDVQLTADRVPVVLHDRHLERLAGWDAQVSELPFDALAALRLRPPGLAEAMAGENPIPTLVDALKLLGQCPQATLFMELKRPSVRHFDRQALVDAVAPLVRGHRRLVAISFDLQLLERLRQQVSLPIGWVIRRSDAAVQKRARQAGVQWLFCRHDRLPDPLWPGFRWVSYTINDLDHARLLHYQGVELVETDDIGGLLAQCELEAARRLS